MTFRMQTLLLPYGYLQINKVAVKGNDYIGHFVKSVNIIFLTCPSTRIYFISGDMKKKTVPAM